MMNEWKRRKDKGQPRLKNAKCRLMNELKKDKIQRTRDKTRM
jgi:hypothetical protein